MNRRNFLRWTGAAAACSVAGAAQAAKTSPHQRPNVVFITADDMNCDSVGVYGCKLPGTTPHLDKLAGEGLRFEYAHVTVANCMPCRNVLHSGLFSHSNGVEGFYQNKEATHAVLPGVLKARGYFVGIKNKVGHSTPYSPYPWDLIEERKQGQPGAGRDPKTFHEFVMQAAKMSREARKRMYLNVNITDPHKPFYGEERSKQSGYDNYPPSRTFDDKDIPIPGFLPDDPVVRHELCQYYDSVRRCDDSVGQTLRALKDAGVEGNTVVMFLSDHGMPFPFAKTNLWHHSTHTPWLVRWPGRVKAGRVDREHMISGVDFMPTVLDIVGITHPEGLQGQSFLPVLLGKSDGGHEYVIKEYNQNAGGSRHPMRGVQTKQYCYLFNPWSDGKRKFRTATQGTRTYKRMVELAKTDKDVAARLQLFDYRVVEEFYDVAKDPDSLHNLIDDSKYKKEIDRHRKILEDWMVRTKDPALDAFRHRTDPKALRAYMDQQDAYAAEQRAKYRKNRPNRRKGGANVKLISMTPPASAPRGGQVTVTISHKLPAKLGEQMFHITLKDGAGKRIERKVLKASGTGTLKVTFDIPDRADLKQVSFAAFVGKDFPSHLQHLVSKPVGVK